MIRNSFLFRMLLVPILVSAAFRASGQIAKWLIPPEYDRITIAPGTEDLLVTELNGEKQLMDFNGQPVADYRSTDKIHPFYRGYAVTTTADGRTITGFYYRDGTYTFIKGLQVAHPSPRFRNGYLLAYDGEYYRFVTCRTVDGKPFGNRYTSAYPFSNHYASCKTYKDIEKKKNEISQLVFYENLKPIDFNLDGKRVDPEDINYISSVNDENVAVVIIKEKVYLFNGETRILTPLFSTSNGSFKNKDKQVKIDKNQMLLVSHAEGYHMVATDPKKHVSITILLDEEERPVSIKYTDTEQVFSKKVVQERVRQQLLSVTQHNGTKGFNWGTDTILPPQFKAIGDFFDDKAIVCLNGKWGLIQAYKDVPFELLLNKGQKVGLRHSVNETTIQLNLPEGVSPQESSLEIIGDDSGCSIDPLRAERHGDGSQVGYITYPCMMDFPSTGLPDTYNEQDNDCHLHYKARVKYNGLLSPEIPFTADVWHYKYITPDIPESDSYFQDGNYHFTLLLSSDEQGQSYYNHVEITLVNNDTTVTYNSLDYNSAITKISESKYDITLRDIAPGINNITYAIVEEGGLETYHSFDVTYEKPVKKTVEKITVKPRINSNRVRKAKKRVVTTTPPKTSEQKDIGAGRLYP